MNTGNHIVTTARIYSCFFATEGQMQRVLRVLDSAPGTFDEVWMGTSTATNPMEEHRAEAARMATFASELRKRGIRPSIELGCCIGHFEAPVAPGGFDGGPEARMVGESGLTLVGVHCPNSESFTDWVCKVTALYCEAVQPDSFYVDDDLRFLSHGAVREGCYCGACLKEFSERTGHDWGREELHARLNSDDYDELRMKWSTFHADSASRFTGRIAAAIHAVAPKTHIGNETDDAMNLYGGWGVTHFYKSIKDATGLEARVRIGGGAWNDYAPVDLLRKALIAGCDADDAKASGNVDVITSELESFPCAALSKSGYSYGLEGAMHLAYGCNATAFQMGALWKNDEGYLCEHVGEIARWRKILDRLSEYSRTCRAGGVTLGISREFINVPTYKGLPNKCWYVVYSFPSLTPMAVSGFPVHWSKETFNAGLEPSIINGETALGLTEDDFRRAYANGLVLTGEGFLELSKRGFLDFANVEGGIAGWASSLDFLDTELTKDIAGENWEWAVLLLLLSASSCFLVPRRSPLAGFRGNVLTGLTSACGHTRTKTADWRFWRRPTNFAGISRRVP